MSPNEKLSNVGEDFALEEGLPREGAVASSGGGGSVPKKGRLSVTSSKYDVDGDGVLDEAEQKMRDMDLSNRGFLSNDKVYKIIQEQMAMQQQMFNMKKVLIGLSIFTVVLALSNLGTAWAAAVLAKDSKVDSSGNMYTIDGTQMVGTKGMALVFDAAPKEDDDRRGLNIYQHTQGRNKDTVPKAIETELSDCSASIRIRHTCNSVIKFYHYNCDTATITPDGNKNVYSDGTVTIESCSGQTCEVLNLPCDAAAAGGGTAGSTTQNSFDANSLTLGQECYSDEECEVNLFCRGGSTETNTLGKCEKKRDNALCNAGTECFSEKCDNNVCTRKNTGEACAKGIECASGLCDLRRDPAAGTCVLATCTDSIADFANTQGSCDPTVIAAPTRSCPIGAGDCCAESTPTYSTFCGCDQSYSFGDANTYYGDYMCLAYGGGGRDLSALPPGDPYYVECTYQWNAARTDCELI